MARRHSRNGPWNERQSRTHISNKKDIEHHTHQETRSRDEKHTCEKIIMFIFIYFILFFILIFILIFFSGSLLICLFIHLIMYWIYASCIHLMYEILFICFFIYVLVYSNNFDCIAAHGVGVHTRARLQPVAAGTHRRNIIGVYCCFCLLNPNS